MIKPQAIQEEFSRELREFANLLGREISDICPDIGPLLRASEMCKDDWKNGTFQYDLDKLNFRISTNKKDCIPQDLYDLTVSLSGSVRFLYTSIDSEKPVDPLNELQFNLNLNGFYNNAGRKKNAQCCWHLDRDDEEGRENQTYMHPFYHFQHGGRNLNRGISYGGSLIIDTPRIAHPPMDAVLGIDFVLTNFVEKDNIKELRDNTTYKRITRRAQRRIWKPYFLAMANAWEIETTETWRSELLFPQILK
jgi:hypothetical protein